jgi:hypothetical protein
MAGVVEQIGHVDLLDVFEADLVEMPSINDGLRGVVRRGGRGRSGISGLLRQIFGTSRFLRGQGIEAEQIVIEVEEFEPFFDLPTIRRMNSGGSPCGTNAGPMFRGVILGQRCEKGLRTQDRGATTSGVLCDLAVTGNDGESPRRGGLLDQSHDEFVGGGSGAGETNVDPSVSADVMGFRNPVADEQDLIAIESTPLQQRGEFLEIDPREFRREDTDDMEHVVGIDQGGQGKDPLERSDAVRLVLDSVGKLARTHESLETMGTNLRNRLSARPK